MFTDKKSDLIEASEANRNLLQYDDKCDKYDYMAAVACGAIGGVMDIFLVGMPGEGILGKWTDQQVDKAVMAFAKKMKWNPKDENENNVNSAIGFLERNFRVNYDQRRTVDVDGAFEISAKMHHMMSLGHSPDIVGLFFSILNQFTMTSSFIADGQLITIESDTFELKGENFIMKIMCGIANWFGHLMSDVAGSSGNHNRGMGITMPFYEFFGFCNFGKFKVGEERKTLAEIAQMAFTYQPEKNSAVMSYDFRFGMTQAIPVVVTEFTIRLIWSLRRHFQYHRPLKECIPSSKNADLRVMLLIGTGTLCALDGIDAGIRSGGNFLLYFMRMNLCAWGRFAVLVLKEVCIRIKMTDALQRQLNAYKRINELLTQYLEQLKQIDLVLYKKEVDKFPDSSNYKFQGYSEQYQAWMYQYGINEIYARHGYVFQTPEVAELFAEKTWYIPDESFDESCLSEVELYNINFLSKCLSTNGSDAGYGVPSNEQSEPSNLYENTGNLVNQYGGYYTNPDTYRIIKVYASDSSYDGMDYLEKVYVTRPQEHFWMEERYGFWQECQESSLLMENRLVLIWYSVIPMMVQGQLKWQLRQFV